MIVRNLFIVITLAIGLFSCTEATEVSEKEVPTVSGSAENEAEMPTEIASEAEARIPEIISFTNNSTFTITKKNTGINAATGSESFDIILNNKLLDAPIKLTNELNMYDVKTGDADIPKSAVFAYSTWYAGGGEIYYGVVNNGVLQIFEKFEDEGMEEEGTYHLFREIDPNVQTKNPAYFIHYSPNDKRGADIMIACSSDGRGLYAKYKGQSRHLAMQFLKDESEGQNVIKTYNELLKNGVNGTYKMTHSGNWDYLQYIYKESGKKYDFTINHDATIVGDTYRTTPSF